METSQRPSTGVGVMVLKDGKVLLHQHQRPNSPAGEFEFPGGHLEYGESFEDCARREVREEAGIEITNVRFGFVTHFLNHSKKHYVHISMIADWQSGEPQQLEPDFGGEWAWYDLDNLPQPIFRMCTLAFDSYKTGVNYYDL